MLALRLLLTKSITSRMLSGALLSLPICCGCRQTPTTVSGSVTLDGKTLSISSDARGKVLFDPVGGHGTVATGALDPSGNFELATGSLREVAPGKYKVAISVSKMLTKTEGAEQGAEFVTPAKYASSKDSGLEADVKPGENHFDFDLAAAAETPSATKADAHPSLTAPDSSATKRN